MPRCRLAQPFEAFHGTVSSPAGQAKLTTYASRIAGQTARRHVKPTVTASAHQVAMQAYSAAAAQHFSAMSAGNVTQWNAMAEQVSRTNILGLNYQLTGNGLHRIRNIYKLMFGYSLTPIVGDPFQPSKILTLFQCVFTPSPDGGITPDKVTIRTTVPTVPNAMHGLCRLSKPLAGEARQANASECTMLDPVISYNLADKGSGLDTMIFRINVPGSGIGQGSRIGIHIVPLNDSLYPGPLFFLRNHLVS